MKSLQSFVFVFLFVFGISSCKKDEIVIDQAVVITHTPEVSSYTSASVRGEVLSDGGGAILAKGFLFGTTSNLIINEDSTIIIPFNAEFNLELSNLSPSTMYYVRAFGVNNTSEPGNGIVYGEEKKIFTNPSINQNSLFGLVSDFDGNVYPTVSICGKEWMASNLRTTKFSNGVSIYNYSETSGFGNFDLPGIPKQRYRSTNELSTSGDLGNYYNTYAIVSDSNLCPTGWHVPRLEDWVDLETCLGEDAGAQMKAIQPWIYAEGTMNSNMSGFSALPASSVDGSSGDDIIYDYKYAIFASSSTTTQNSALVLQARRLSYNNNECEPVVHTLNDALSVRCVRD